MINKGTWVLIHKIVLKPSERAKTIPDDTKQVPLEMWVKGNLLQDAEIGDTVRVKTRIGRIEEGTLQETGPYYKHNYGEYVDVINEVGRIVRDIFDRGDLYE